MTEAMGPFIQACHGYSLYRPLLSDRSDLSGGCSGADLYRLGGCVHSDLCQTHSLMCLEHGASTQKQEPHFLPAIQLQSRKIVVHGWDYSTAIDTTMVPKTRQRVEDQIEPSL